jgi:hypothetical protein
MLIAGESKSSNWPDFTAQKNIATAKMSMAMDSGINQKITSNLVHSTVYKCHLSQFLGCFNQPEILGTNPNPKILQ